MTIFARFKVIDENYKAGVVRRLMESSTPDFDYFYLSGLATFMAALGLLVNSSAIVIGSMLIAPILYPILGIALGLVMSHQKVLGRSLITMFKSFGFGILLAAVATLLFDVNSGGVLNSEILARTQPNLIYFMVSVVAGLAVSYALAQPGWNETIPGIAISVALIPPLAAVGIGLALLNVMVISGALVLLAINVIGIVFAAMVSFSLMDLHEKHKIAESTIKKEEERIQEENQAIEEITNGEDKKEEGSKKESEDKGNEENKKSQPEHTEQHEIQ